MSQFPNKLAADDLARERGVTRQQVLASLGGTETVTASRALTDADDGKVLECTTTLTLTVPAGLRAGFKCKVLTSGTTSIASGATVPLLNGATTTLTRAAASHPVIEIIGRASAANSYLVTGA